MNNLTITDIAKEAGVSKTTISRVLNHSGAVKPETREKILGIIEKNHYSPSATARNLSKQTSSAIGVVVPEVDNPFFGEVLRGITEIADKNDLTLICCNTDDNVKKDRRALTMLKEYRICGLLYTPAVDYSSNKEKKNLKKMIEELNTPVVLMDREIDYLNLDGVYFDDYQGMHDATEILIQNGHRKIGIINGTLDQVLARRRQGGYIKALREAGIDPDERYMLYGNYRMTRAYELSLELLAMEDRPTAVLTCNNRTSMGFLRALHEKGVRTPEDIACIGLDRIEALDIVGNSFNYIKRDAKKMGRMAVDLLINRMAFPDRPYVKKNIETPIVIKKL